MIYLKFKLLSSITDDFIGTEYLVRNEGWKHNVFDYGEREGTFDQRELGVDFLGYITRILVFENNEDKDYPRYDWSIDGITNIRSGIEQELFKPLLKEMEDFTNTNNKTAFYNYKNVLEKVLGLNSPLRVVINLQEVRMFLK